MVELVKFTVAPLLGTPLAVKFALNQMKVPALMAVPLKLEVLLDCAAQGGGGPWGPQFRLAGVKTMSTVLKVSPLLSTNVAVPEKLMDVVAGPAAFVTVVLKLRFASGKTGMESLMLNVDPSLAVTRIV